MTLTIDDQLPGGNIIVDDIADNAATLRQDLRDTEGWWFWWAFRLTGGAGRRLTVTFVDGDVLGELGPAASFDGGDTWRWLGKESVEREPGGRKKTARFTTAIPADCPEARFAMAIPYTPADLDRFLDSLGNTAREAIVRDTLCRSRQNHDVPRLRLGRLDGAAPFALLLTARHHACECMANYVMEGMMAAVLADDDLGRWFRQRVEVTAIPFVDFDGVRGGDQGKNRAPHDHNRDYIDEPLYPETAAIIRTIPPWIGDRRGVVLDLHCPYIRNGETNEATYFVGTQHAACWENVRRLSALLRETSAGSLRHTGDADLAFGEKWNTGDIVHCFTHWAGGLASVEIANSMEIPYAEANGREVNPQSARAFGRDLAEAVRRYLGTAD